MKSNRNLSVISIVAVALFLAGCDNGFIANKDKQPFSPNIITLREVPDSALKELLDENLTFVDGAGTEWVAPKGTVTDGASVPRLALWMTDGRFAKGFLKAAVIHDAYCQSDNEARSPKQYRTKTWQTVHRMFYDAMLAGGTTKIEASLMFAAVWLGGPRWNDPSRMLDTVADEALGEVYLECIEWIKKEDPSSEEIEAWMNEREVDLLAATQ